MTDRVTACLPEWVIARAQSLVGAVNEDALREWNLANAVARHYYFKHHAVRQPVHPQCGSERGYQHHRWLKERQCERCKRAHSKHNSSRRSAQRRLRRVA